jgi:hypothetical protein
MLEHSQNSEFSFRSSPKNARKLQKSFSAIKQIRNEEDSSKDYNSNLSLILNL